MDSKHTGIIYDKVESRKYRSCAQLRQYNETVPDGWIVIPGASVGLTAGAA